MKKFLIIMMILITTFSNCTVAAQQLKQDGFTDVPKGDRYEPYINELKTLGITQGRGDGSFGYNQNMTRAEFLSFLVKTMQLQAGKLPGNSLFKDVKASDWYYSAVYTGIKNGILLQKEYADGKYEPNKPVTREEAAMMIVRALRYDGLAVQLDSRATQFTDVQSHKGYIEIAKDLGIINGKTQTAFSPKAPVLRQEAAEMLIKLYDAVNNKLAAVNGFYAIKSNSQVGKTGTFDSISYGWGRVEYNKTSGKVELATKYSASGQPFYIPQDYQLTTAEADKNNTGKYIMIFGTNEDKVSVNGQSTGLLSDLLGDGAAVQKLVQDITKISGDIEGNGSGVGFDGVVIDFEALRNKGEDKANFVKLLTALRQQLDTAGKQLLVCVNPQREPGQLYYDGYDFKSIGQLADYVILMAHDYEPKSLSAQEMKFFQGETPIAPLKDVYTALEYAADPANGIPRDKLLLQVNFGAAQWQFKDGKILNSRPYNPDYAKIVKRMTDTGVKNKKLAYSDIYQSPYLTFESDGIKNIIWYEDSRSIAAKTRLAQLFGIKGISVWRLGLVPDFDKANDKVDYMDLWSLLSQIGK